MRILRRYMRGQDVLDVKKRLVELGYLEKATHDLYGNDTFRAVKAFQTANGLEQDGITGELTMAALFDREPVDAPDIPSNISARKAAAISAALAVAGVSATRRGIVLEALKWAVDADKLEELKCFYIRGGNLYNTDLSVNRMTDAKLERYLSRKAYEPYYKDARQMMRSMAENSGYTIAGADCSGFIVGLWRNARVCSAGFDANANSLYSSFCTDTMNPIPGDLCWRSGHIGLYVGGGYAVESIGGNYGVQITRVAKRQAYSFIDCKLHTFGAWSKYGDPKKY